MGTCTHQHVQARNEEGSSTAAGAGPGCARGSCGRLGGGRPGSRRGQRAVPADASRAGRWRGVRADHRGAHHRRGPGLPGTPCRSGIGPPDALPKNSFLRVRGLPPTVSLSEGYVTAPGAWSVPIHALPTLQMIVPTGVTGRAELSISLVTEDGALLAQARTILVVQPPPQPPSPPKEVRAEPPKAQPPPRAARTHPVARGPRRGASV